MFRNLESMLCNIQFVRMIYGEKYFCREKSGVTIVKRLPNAEHPHHISTTVPYRTVPEVVVSLRFSDGSYQHACSLTFFFFQNTAPPLPL
jgi:hypothetical protein